MNNFPGILRYRRNAMLALVYGAIIGISFYLAYEVRFDFIVWPQYQLDRLHGILLVIALKLIALAWAQQFESMFTYFGIRDLLRLGWSMTACSAFLLLLDLPHFALFSPPRGVLLVDYFVCLAGLCSVRLGARLYRERIAMVQSASVGPIQRIAIIGAGDAGAALASEFLNNPRRGFRPVAFFDDNPSKHGKLVHGVPVLGRPDEMQRLLDKDSVAKIVIAMPSAAARRVREVVQLATQAGLKVETLPSLAELTSGRARASRVRPVEVQDLLGREAVDLDSDGIKKLIEERVVMVTGAGGSIGAELCRQIAELRPKRLILVEQSEGNLFMIEQELVERGFGASIAPIVADILDRERMEHVFARYRPEIVFHAAAHKHVYLMERQPAEAISNNVFGTQQLARFASAFGVGKFVFISTDKAINPTSVMGATKRLAEIEIQEIQAKQNGSGATEFMAVRFGNVLGSSGSVVPIFKHQIENGGPVTVTHPEVTRYFMTIPEAVGLVLQTAVLGRGGEIFVLDMGQPIRIVDLARQMIVLSGFKPGEDIEIKFTGLKPGEKLSEEYQHRNEQHKPTEHPRIMRFESAKSAEGPSLKVLEDRLHQLEPNDLKKLLRQFVPEYTPYLD